MKNITVFLSENFSVFGGEIFNIFEKACFRNASVFESLKCYCTHTTNGTEPAPWLSRMRVQLVIRRSQVRSPPGSATFFRGD